MNLPRQEITSKQSASAGVLISITLDCGVRGREFESSGWLENFPGKQMSKQCNMT